MAFRTGGAGRRRLGAGAGVGKGPVGRRLRLLQPARARLRRRTPRRQGDRHDGRGGRHGLPDGRPGGGGARRRTVVLAASADGGTFGQVPGLRVRVLDAASGAEIARFDSEDATVETAFVLGELYRRQGGWKFRAIGQGYGSGLAGLATDFGISVDEPQQRAAPTPTAPAPPPPTPSAPPAPMGTPAPPVPAAPPAPPASGTAPRTPVRLSKVTLTKEAPSVSLTKQGGTSGAMRVNLNWQERKQDDKQTKGWAAKLSRAVAAQSPLDLDLCALYELTDGRKGVVQALGNAFGALDRPPFIQLDGDDRTGAGHRREPHHQPRPQGPAAPHPHLRDHLRRREQFRRPGRDGDPPAAARRRDRLLTRRMHGALDGVRPRADHQYRHRPRRPARGPLPRPRARRQPAAHRSTGSTAGA